MDFVSKLIEIFVLGLIGGANPGPILAASFTEALRKGFIGSLKVIFMAILAETIVAGFILFLFFSINIPNYIFYIISFVGAGVLIWLASKVWKIKEIGGEGELFSFKKIFLLTIFNGPFWIFWIAICVPQAFLLKEKIAYGQVWFLILFELGWLVGTVFLVYLFSCFRPLLSKTKFVPVIFKIFALILIFFAIKLIYGSIMFFIK